MNGTLFRVFFAVSAAIALIVSGSTLLRLLHARLRGCVVPRPPMIPLSLLTATYAAALMLVLASDAQQRSSVAQLGAFYFVFAGPFVAFLLMAFLSSQRRLSSYHRVAFYAATIYLPVWFVAAALITYGMMALAGE